ncbi:Mannose-6-phosphate isomerase, cupin superfamily [Salegentibacter holothuriorum]|uniref:Mannose-6-phosphate isomerase, cupin superfamily n=1 Tax=Salegentibacter holothuriorum TaxID=241145 RepID=A0A1T5C2U2_9FLAO|nr:cupin domain-containing protein [Salegentibacter holothuriorum]SKB53731.1 Mannose-6-phosphate isomerase, cupin superfamily [Salegentibacter holothuriorum]
MKSEKVNLKDKFELFKEYWNPKIIGELNGQQVKLAKLKGEFVWHDHKEEDEMFLVIKGSLKIEFRDNTISLNKGEMYIVPKGVEHKPIAEEEAWVLLFEPANTKHTGEVKNKLSVENQEWI